MRLVLPLLALLLALPVHADTLRIGSKRFTESYILGEVLRRTVEGKTPVEHRPGLGNTGIVFAALKAGSIDLYPEYTGTIAREILRVDGHPGIGDLNSALAPQGLPSVGAGFEVSSVHRPRRVRLRSRRGRGRSSRGGRRRG